MASTGNETIGYVLTPKSKYAIESDSYLVQISSLKSCTEDLCDQGDCPDCLMPFAWDAHPQRPQIKPHLER